MEFPKIKPAVSPTQPETSFNSHEAHVAALDKSGFLGLPGKQPTEDERRLMLFKNFLDSHWGLPAVVVLFRTLFSEGGYPPISVPTRWYIPKNIDLTRLVWEQIQTENFIDEIWPSIKMLLGDDVLNYEWAARVATVLSLFNIIRVLPLVLTEDGDYLSKK